MSKRTCSIDECKRPHAARGMCLNHYSAARRRGLPTISRDPADRLERNSRSSGDCREWVKMRDVKGYGRVRFEGRTILAHRMAYTVFVGEIPDGINVDHICGNPPCINPDHLRLATEGENRHNWVAVRKNATGHRGVTLRADCRLQFEATVAFKGQKYPLGRYATAEEAGSAARIGRYILHRRSEKDKMNITRDEALALIPEKFRGRVAEAAFREES